MPGEQRECEAERSIEGLEPRRKLRSSGSARYLAVAAGAVCAMIAAGIVLSGLSMFTDPIMAELWPNGEISRARVQTYFTVLLMVSIAVMPVAGRVIGRLGGRVLLTTGGIIGGLGLAGLSTVQGMTGLYVFGALTGAGFGMSVNFVPIILVNNWFDRHRGLVMGLVMAGTGLGGILSSVVFSNLAPPVEAGGIGWRATMLIAAGLFASFAVIPALLLVVNRPEDVGLPMYGQEAPLAGWVTTSQPPEARVTRLTGLSFAETMRSGWFWLLYLMLILLGVYYAMGQITQPFFVNQQTDPGSQMTPALVGILMSMQMVGLIIAKPVLGTLIERFGIIKAMAVFMAVHAVAGYLLGVIRYPAPGYILLVIGLVGAGFATGSLTAPLACSLAFGQRAYAAVYGVLGTAYMLGLAVGAVLWSSAGSLGADPSQPWQLYRVAMQWSWVISIVVLIGYLLAIRGGRARQRVLHPDTDVPAVRL